jgi:predicted ATPase
LIKLEIAIVRECQALLTRVDIQNYRSIYKASVPLFPFTLLIGANGTGKSNFLKLLKDASMTGRKKPYTLKGHRIASTTAEPFPNSKHYAFIAEDQLIAICNDEMAIYQVKEGDKVPSNLPELQDVKIFSLKPENAGRREDLALSPTVHEDGTGIVQVLDSLKTGDREDLFNLIEKTFKQHIPEIEKLSFIPSSNAKQLQVREQYLPIPNPVSQLSEGMQLALMLITILYQEHRPSLVCIEDIDRGLHPRLFQRIVELCFDLSEGENAVQIIATTHNPYLVDEFKDHEEAVIIVEKENGQTKFTTLAERMEKLGSTEEPLGSLWYSGFVGGVPQSAL